ncbi:alpha/beta fold hydrolase [Sphingomonas hengshuiensis]|uniref:Alpha/beta hydrolase n=1 Tax=Sphingomonas hengshuiensis TaxID=1609977 RepID=A0A7U5BF48_9SPHN|nr:alpha/beta hydrolase [Sphingomonas hengshuiensis]AJP74125.1 alpha/beta hydrolase [Sphingomonas hengshuiensis]
MVALERVALSTGVELDVAVAGDPANPPIFLLHGFPESHHTWRHQIPVLAKTHFVIAPDQRGYARSSKPEGVENYSPDKPVADLMALADHFGIESFTLVGHDWGGAIAWMAGLQHPKRVTQLVILNAPHPQIFQRKLFDDPEQRKASQYVRYFRETDFDKGVTGAALERFFSSLFVQHLAATVSDEDKAQYLVDWGQPGAMTAMLNWYRATSMIVPGMDEDVERPAWIDGPFPLQPQPTLVIWGLRDTGLLPCLLDGLDQLIPDYTLVRIEDGGHFIPWEKHEQVTAALVHWLGRRTAV